MVAVHGAVTPHSRRRSVDQLRTVHTARRDAGERSVRRLVAPLSPARLRAVRPELVCDTHRDAVGVTRKLQYAASDGRVGERSRKTI